MGIGKASHAAAFRGAVQQWAMVVLSMHPVTLVLAFAVTVVASGPLLTLGRRRCTKHIVKAAYAWAPMRARKCRCGDRVVYE